MRTYRSCRYAVYSPIAHRSRTDGQGFFKRLALGFFWDSFGILLGFFWDSFGILLGIFLGFSWDFPGIFLGGVRDCPVIFQVLHSGAHTLPSTIFPIRGYLLRAATSS